MLGNKVHIVLSTLVVLMLADCAHCQTSCPDIAPTSTKELVGFLQRYGREADPECVRKLIVQIGDAKDPSAINVLIAYLDFRRPDNEMEKKGFFRLEDKYPAVESLFQIGQPAVPALLSMIASSNASTLSRKNALRALEEIHSEDPSEAITILRKAARSAKKSEEAARLESAANDVMAYCGSHWRAKCAAALHSQRTPASN